MSALLPYLIPALLLLVIGIFFVGGILSVGALSQWLDRRRQTFFSLMLWMIAVGIAIPSLTKKRTLTEDVLLNMPAYLGGGDKIASAGFWVTKILTWLVVLLAAALLTSRFLQARSSYASARQGNAPVFLILAVAVFLITGGLVNSLFGTKPDLGHDLIYPFLLFGVALTLPGEGYVNTARTVRNLIVALCAASLLMALISPDQVLQTGHKGLIPGFNLRLWGTMPHANALGGLSLFYLIVERLVPWKNCTLRWLAWGLVFVTLILTQSKTNWMIGLALAGILFALEMRRALGEGVKNPLRQQAVAAVLSILIIGTVVAYAGLLVIGPETLADRIGRDFVSAGGTTLTGRDVIWALAINEWQANPLFGYGPAMWDDEYRQAVRVAYAFHGHNQYLNTLSRAGLFGMAGLVLMLVAYAYYAMRYFTVTHGVLLAVLAMILIRGFTESPMAVWGVFSQETLINLTLVALIAQLVRSETADSSLHLRKMGTT
jgi:O-antigen ligase